MTAEDKSVLDTQSLSFLLIMWQKYGWLICVSCFVRDMPIFHRNVLTGDGWGWLPLIPLLFSFLHHLVMGVVKTREAAHLSCIFSHLVNAETGIGSFTWYMPWQGVRLNRLFLVSKNYDCLIIPMFPLSIKGWHFSVQFQQIQVLLCREHSVTVFLPEPLILCFCYLDSYWLWGRSVAGGCWCYHLVPGDIAGTEFIYKSNCSSTFNFSSWSLKLEVDFWIHHSVQYNPCSLQQKLMSKCGAGRGESGGFQ